MQATVRLERLEARNRRSAQRRKLSLGTVVGQRGDEAVVLDLSTTGILIETRAELATFEQLQLDLPEVGTVAATVLWNSGHYFGCEFHQSIPQAAISAALLRSPVSQTMSAGTTLEQEDVPEADDQADDRYPLGVRLRVILGASLALWALILWALRIL